MPDWAKSQCCKMTFQGASKVSMIVLLLEAYGKDIRKVA
jgi:hypothetical protein